MHLLLDKAVLPPFDARHSPEMHAAQIATPPAREAFAAKAVSDSFDALPFGAERMEVLLGAEPSASSLVLAFSAGGLCGAVVAGLLIPALPALAFGASLGAYAGVLGASLWVSRTGDRYVRSR